MVNIKVALYVQPRMVISIFFDDILKILARLKLEERLRTLTVLRAIVLTVAE